MSDGRSTLLYRIETGIVGVMLFLAVIVGVYAAWWAGVAMLFVFLLGAIFRDLYNLRMGRFEA